MTRHQLLSFVFTLALGVGAAVGAQTDGAAAKNSRSEKAPRTLMPVPAAIEVESDIVYKTVGGEKLALDLYRVKDREYDSAPVVIPAQSRLLPPPRRNHRAHPEFQIALSRRRTSAPTFISS